VYFLKESLIANIITRLNTGVKIAVKHHKSSLTVIKPSSLISKNIW
jgi:hypothetical protein